MSPRRPMPAPTDEAMHRIGATALAFARAVDARSLELTVTVVAPVPGDPSDEVDVPVGVPVDVHVGIDRQADESEAVDVAAGAKSNPRKRIQATGAMFDAVARAPTLELGTGA